MTSTSEDLEAESQLKIFQLSAAGWTEWVGGWKRVDHSLSSNPGFIILQYRQASDRRPTTSVCSAVGSRAQRQNDANLGPLSIQNSRSADGFLDTVSRVETCPSVTICYARSVILRLRDKSRITKLVPPPKDCMHSPQSANTVTKITYRVLIRKFASKSAKRGAKTKNNRLYFGMTCILISEIIGNNWLKYQRETVRIQCLTIKQPTAKNSPSEPVENGIR